MEFLNNITVLEENVVNSAEFATIVIGVAFLIFIITFVVWAAYVIIRANRKKIASEASLRKSQEDVVNKNVKKNN